MNKNNIFFLTITVSFLFYGCSSRGYGVYHPQPMAIKEKKHFYKTTTLPKKEYKKATMRPYTIRGKTYYPKVVKVGEKFHGIASWYGPNFHGKWTSNGERFDMYQLTAAHKTFPMNTLVKVTNKNNGKSVVVRINDRGPFVGTRIIDLSKAAAKQIGMIGTGTAPVELEIIGYATTKKPKYKQKVLKTTKQQPILKDEKGNFALQIGSFTNIQGAIKTQEKYDGIDGHNTIIKDVEKNNQRIFKVWLLGFKSKLQAQAYKEQKFQNAFIVKED